MHEMFALKLPISCLFCIFYTTSTTGTGLAQLIVLYSCLFGEVTSKTQYCCCVSGTR
jgi:hypothetical protein